MLLYQKSYSNIDSRLDAIMANLTIHEDATGMYAMVPSSSDFGKKYRVNINKETMLSVNCPCVATGDCLHRNATDRVTEDARALLFAAKKAALLKSVVVEETVNIEELPLQEQEELQAAEQVEMPVEDNEAVYGRIVNNQIVNVRWADLTSTEKATYYSNYVSLLNGWNCIGA